MRTHEPVRDGCGTPLTEVVSGVAEMAAPPVESPQATRGALEATDGNVEVEPPAVFNTVLNAPTCEALVVSAQLEDRHIPSAGPRELTEHPLLLPEGLKLEPQTLSVCCCDELRTGPFGDEPNGEHLAYYTGVQRPFRAYDLMSSRQAIG